MRVCERAFDKRHDLRFARHGIRTAFATQLHRRLLLPGRRRHHVDHRGHVLHLLRERPDTLELAVRRRKVVFVRGHGVRQRHKLALERAQLAVVDFCDCRRFGGPCPGRRKKRTSQENCDGRFHHRDAVLSVSMAGARAITAKPVAVDEIHWSLPGVCRVPRRSSRLPAR